jgi:subtilisin family serine protease
MRLNRILCWSASALLVGLAACQKDSDPTSPSDSPIIAAAKKPPTYLISLSTAPADLASRVAQAGGRLKKVSKEAGIASAESDAVDFATKMKAVPGVEAVGQDRVIRWVDPNQRIMEAGEAVADAGRGDGSIGGDETFYNAQWAPKAVGAPEAWKAGARGTGVRVAVLDGGLNNTHIDLNGSVDVTCSASMVEGFNFNQDVPGFSHATHVAGIVAARDNSVGTIGVAPGATIMGVKVLQNGSGSFEDVIDGILYAAKPRNTPGKEACARADIINMSLGATFAPEREDKELLRALDKATTFANKQGVTVIAAAGNEGVNLDRARDSVSVPAQSAKVLAISATGPVGFAVKYPNGATNFSRIASYTNFGESIINFAAPGGDFVLPGEKRCTLPRIPRGKITTQCWVFDMVISPGTIATTSNSGYFFAAGTSMASPMAAGVAALIIERNGGSMSPDQVAARLRRSSDDLGEAGFDAFYGDGFVDALRAVR